MKKIIIAAVFIAAFVGAFFFIFSPHDMTKDDITKAFEEHRSSYNKVGEYFTKHTDIDPKYIYEQDASNYPEIKDAIKNTLENGFLYIGVSSDHKEISFGTSSQSESDNHKLIYSPYGKPSSEPDAETIKNSAWYIKM